MKFLVKNFSDIKSIENTQITFKTGEKIIFTECLGNRYESAVCVAERDYTASPPYFEFFTNDIPTRIIFDKKGLFSKSINRKRFVKLQRQIIGFGYSTYDLS